MAIMTQAMKLKGILLLHIIHEMLQFLTHNARSPSSVIAPSKLIYMHASTIYRIL